MLETLRNSAKSWIAKLLFGILILSFAVWGVGDMVRVGITRIPAIEAGSVEITADEVVRDYKREVSRLQRSLGGEFTEEQARQLGLLDRTLQQMTARALLDQATRDFDMMAPDDVLRRAIAENPTFRNQLGQFDPALFRQALASAGYSEAEFVEIARGDLMRGQLVQALAGGVSAPAALVDPLFAYRREKRVADVMTFSADSMPVPPPPPEEVLAQYHEANAQRFMAPEYRAVTALLLRPADVAGDVRLTDEDIREAYDQRIAEFQQAEKRNVRQILFQDEAAARQAAEALKAGQDFAAVATAANKEPIELGWVDRQSLPPDLVEPVFALGEGAVSDPVQSGLGWHVFQVTGIQAAQIRPLEEVRDQIVQDVTNERAVDRLYELANKVEDTLAGGATLEEAAAKLNLRLVKAEAVDAQGRGPAGQPAGDLPTDPRFLATAFETPEGSESRMAEMAGNSFFIVRVDKVTPPAVRPFATVKDQVLQAWQTEQRTAEARKVAEQAAARLRNGEPAATVAASLGTTLRTTEPFTREPAAATGVAPAVADAVFGLAQPGEVAVAPEPAGATVAQLRQVLPADPAAEKALYDRMRAELGQALSSDLVDQYIAALNDRYKATINRQAVEDALQ